MFIHPRFICTFLGTQVQSSRPNGEKTAMTRSIPPTLAQLRYTRVYSDAQGEAL